MSYILTEEGIQSYQESFSYLANSILDTPKGLYNKQNITKFLKQYPQLRLMNINDLMSILSNDNPTIQQIFAQLYGMGITIWMFNSYEIAKIIKEKDRKLYSKTVSHFKAIYTTIEKNGGGVILDAAVKVIEPTVQMLINKDIAKGYVVSKDKIKSNS